MIRTQPADCADPQSAVLCVGEGALPAFDTLKSRRQFLAVARTGKRSVRPGLILQAGDKHDEGPGSSRCSPRIGFTVSRKVGNAVERNRVKRRFRVLARQLLAEKADPARDYVLVGRRGAVKRPFGLLQKDLEQAMRDLETERDQEQ